MLGLELQDSCCRVAESLHHQMYVYTIEMGLVLCCTGKKSCFLLVRPRPELHMLICTKTCIVAFAQTLVRPSMEVS